MIISAATQAMMEKVMKKTKLGQMKSKKLPPTKSRDHRNPTLRWSLFIFNIELKKVGLEVGGLIL
jgi:hypothetical protein